MHGDAMEVGALRSKSPRGGHGDICMGVPWKYVSSEASHREEAMGIYARGCHGGKGAWKQIIGRRP